MKIKRAVLSITAAGAVLLAGEISIQAYAQSQPAAPVASTTPSAPTSATTSAAPVAAKTDVVKTEDQPGFSVIGLSVRTNRAKEAGGDGEIPKIWQKAMGESLLENIPNRADGGLVAVYTDFSMENGGEYTYVLGVRVSSTAKIPDGFVAVNVPAGKYAVVPSEQGALPDVLPKVWMKIGRMTADELGGARAHQADYELYPAGFDWQNAQIDVHLGLK